jgi:glycosyltransferase involved in cell wall biosynthesis
MGKKNTKKKQLPFVSICTPTFNRRPFIQTMFTCFQNQTYPKDRMEWIIVDDGTDKIEDLIKSAQIPQIRYFQIDTKMTLGAKRNYTHSKSKGSILVYMDDDDYYPPERVEHAVTTLQKNPNALCAGSSEIYVYFKHIQKMYRGGPYSENHATAGTFAFRRELLNQTKYNEHACLAEEREFLKNYTIPFVQLDAKKTILVFSHIQNTFDKKRLLNTPSPKFVPCDIKIDEFIKHDYENPIKQYFLVDIEKELAAYKPGDPIMKPDVIKQTKEIEKQREELQKKMMMEQGHGSIVIQRPGQEPHALNKQEIVGLLESQKKEIESRGKKIETLEMLVVKMRDELHRIKETQANNSPKCHDVQMRTSKLIPEHMIPLPIPISI